MTGLQVVYAQAVQNTKARESRYFYEVHHRIICRYAELYGTPLINACIAFARLSPRTSITLNLKAFILLLDGKPKPRAVLTANWQSASNALILSESEAVDYLYNQPLSKVRAFARNLLLDDSVITLDAIMYRILREHYPIPSLNHLFQHYSEWHNEIYPVIRQLDNTVPPYGIQAILWDYARRLYKPVSARDNRETPKTRIFDSSQTLRIGV
jgi:hypothetical protein